VADQS